MQANVVSRDLRAKYERIVRDGREAEQRAAEATVTGPFVIAMASALAHYAQAWQLADIATSMAPSNQYSRWCETRSVAHGLVARVRQQLTDMAGVLA